MLTDFQICISVSLISFVIQCSKGLKFLLENFLLAIFTNKYKIVVKIQISVNKYSKKLLTLILPNFRTANTGLHGFMFVACTYSYIWNQSK